MEDCDSNYYKDFKIIKNIHSEFKKKPSREGIDKMLEVLQRNSLTINSIVIYNYSLLHVPQEYDTMKYLIEKNGDVNLKNDYGITPIFTQKNYETIKLLVENGADIHTTCNYNFNPLFWQKEPKAMKYLLKKGLNINHFNTIFNFKENSVINDMYNEMFILGGYDPYNEKNISISPLFLQRDYNTQEMMLDWCLRKNMMYYHVDLFLETPLFKPCINKELIQLYLDYGENINHKNSMHNTLLYVHTDPDIILFLLQNDIDLTSRNVFNKTAYYHHYKKENIYICDIIRDYYSSTLIQRNWLRFKFRKSYVPLKNYKIKKELIKYIELLPPSECGLFPGGIEYQKSLEDFTQHLQHLL